MEPGVPIFTPLYIFVLLLFLLILLLIAFVSGTVGALLTLPVLYYTGYGLLPPRMTPALSETRFTDAALGHLFFGGILGIGCVFVTYGVDYLIPFLVEYEFARTSPRLKSLPQLAVGTGLVVGVSWLGYVVVGRERLPEDVDAGWTTAVLASARVAGAFAICFIAVLVLSSAITFLYG